MGFSANSSWTYDESNNQIFRFDNCLKTCQKLNTSWLMLTGQLVQRLRLFYWSKTTFATVPTNLRNDCIRRGYHMFSMRRGRNFPVNCINSFFYSLTLPGKVSFCHHLASVNFSHFNLLLWKRKANWSEIW